MDTLNGFLADDPAATKVALRQTLYEIDTLNPDWKLE